MSADIGPAPPYSWAATLLLYSCDISGHLKEFDDIFPGLNGQSTIEGNQIGFLCRQGVGLHAVNAADQPIKANPIMLCNSGQGLQTGGILAVFDVCDV